jgi:hypothetical protein
MTDEEWETSLKSLNEEAKKWVDEEIMKIQCKVIHDIIGEDLKDD